MSKSRSKAKIENIWQHIRIGDYNLEVVDSLKRRCEEEFLENNGCRIGYNKELYDIYNEICNMIKLRKRGKRRNEHILRMGESRIFKNFRPINRNSVETESASLLDFRN